MDQQINKLLEQNRVANYYSTPGLNASLLKALDNSPGYVKWQMDNPDAKDEDKRVFRVGGAIDTSLTDPDNFKKLYTCINVQRPPENMVKFISYLPDNIDNVSPEVLEKATINSGYKSKGAALLKKLKENKDYLVFFKKVKAAKGKKIISQDEMDEVKHMSDTLLKNPLTSRYFRSDNPRRILLHQVAIFWKYMGESCKGLLDIIEIDLDKKTIQPMDLKSTGLSIHGFQSQIEKLKYYLQAGHYHLGITNALNDPSNYAPEPLLNALREDFEVLPMKFIAVESNPSGRQPAIIFTMTASDLHCSIFGGISNYSGEKIKGVLELIQDYTWHKETGVWNCSRTLYENKGEIELNLFKRI